MSYSKIRFTDQSMSSLVEKQRLKKIFHMGEGVITVLKKNLIYILSGSLIWQTFFFRFEIFKQNYFNHRQLYVSISGFFKTFLLSESWNLSRSFPTN